jgi:hypothetical protein
LFAHPSTDFVYVVGDTHSGGEVAVDYRVVDGRIAEAPMASYGSGTRGQLFRYDVKTGRGHLLTLEQARELTLDAAASSPDGFRVTYAEGNGSGLFPFDNGDGTAAVYLDGRGARLKLDLVVGRPYESNGFHFVAWVR